jgi:ubiquinone biosynthesis protein UbiJ
MEFAGSTATHQPRPPFRPLTHSLPERQLARMERGREIIASMADEIREIRRDIATLSDRLHRVDMIIDNALRKLM